MHSIARQKFLDPGTNPYHLKLLSIISYLKAYPVSKISRKFINRLLSDPAYRQTNRRKY